MIEVEESQCFHNVQHMYFVMDAQYISNSIRIFRFIFSLFKYIAYL